MSARAAHHELRSSTRQQFFWRFLLSGLIGLFVIGLFLSLDARQTGRVGSSTPSRAFPTLPGATVAPIGSAHDPALVVTSLQTGGEAEKGGIHVGDLLLTVEGKSVLSPSELRRALLAADTSTLHARLRRGTQTLSTALKR